LRVRRGVVQPEPASIDAIFERYGVGGPWRPLPSTGLANAIYATASVVLRVATDHPDAVADARTESVAAPAARAAGIQTPQLIAFDDTRTLVDRPFSLWERVHGEPLGQLALDPRRAREAWTRVGRELARLHLRVLACPDPKRFLDQPWREPDVAARLAPVVDAGRLTVADARRIEQFAAALQPHLVEPDRPRFLHNDLHPMNVLCSTRGALRAIIDWGDAGWGDPALEFAAVPIDAMPWTLEGYTVEAPGLLGARPEVRFAWDKLVGSLEDLRDHPDRPLDWPALLDDLRDMSTGSLGPAS
jgi:Ser/Thr protein kinase RdoA (MazF antagonist)